MREELVHIDISKGHSHVRMVRAACGAEKRGATLVVPEHEFLPPQQRYVNCVREDGAANCPDCLDAGYIKIGYYWVKPEEIQDP